jgi:gliding motility-associated-like protein
VNIISKGLNGCTGVYTYPSPIVVHSRPEAEIIWSPEKPTTSDEITFHPSGKTEIVYNSWTFEGGESLDYDTLTIGSSVDSTTIRTPRRKYEKFGKYHVMLVAINEKGCVDTVNRFIDVIDDLNIYIPNSFTPNGDGINDYFGVKGQGIRAEGFTMDLYDRWGASVFFTRDPNDPWDGKVKGVKAGDGVYTYRIRVVGMNGEGRKELVGHFTLLK